MLFIHIFCTIFITDRARGALLLEILLSYICILFYPTMFSPEGQSFTRTFFISSLANMFVRTSQYLSVNNVIFYLLFSLCDS